MSDKYKDMKNKDLKEYCEEEGIDVDSKNVSKPTRTEYIDSIEAFEASNGEKVVTEKFETIADEDDFVKEVKMVQAETISASPRKKRISKKNHPLMSLKRVIVTSNANNQTKTGGIERISWGNRTLGHNTDNVMIGKPWHVREGALRNLKSATIRISTTDDNGNHAGVDKAPAWVIQYLDPLTKEEINKIAKRQTIRDASIDSLI